MEPGTSGAAVVAVSHGEYRECSASCAGIIVGGHTGRQGVWLLQYATIMKVLDIVRFLPDMSLDEPDQDLAQQAQQDFQLICEPLPLHCCTELEPYTKGSQPLQMDKTTVCLTAVMLEEWDRTTVPRQGSTETIIKIGRRHKVQEAVEANIKNSKIRDAIQRTARFDYGKTSGMTN